MTTAPQPRTAPRPGARRPVVVVLAILAVVASLLTTAPATPPDATWLVRQGTPLPTGAVVVESFPVADALVVAAPHRPRGAIDVDTPLTWRSSDVAEPESEPFDAGDGAPDGSLADDSPISWTGADGAWASGEDGSRALVALVDTGVAPVEGLEGAVAGEIDFSGAGGGDGYGHGTFLASLIAARHETVTGVAPGAGVLSLKVAGDEGDTDLGTVLGALQWLHGPGSQAGIRVAVLALGVDPDTKAARLLDEATDRLADQGVLVVTAAGNDGPDRLSSPATARRTFSVGAVDHRDDSVKPASFSATGTDRAGVAQPDVYSPGVRVAGWVAPGSRIAETHAQSVEGGRWLRGSGTSMSAALTGGVAALVSSARPDLDGQGIEQALRAGDGRLDAAAAVAAAGEVPPGASNGPSAAAGKGPKAAAGNGPKAAAGNGPKAAASNGPKAAGGKGPGAALPATPAWSPAHWESVRWVGGAWGSVRWVGDRWESVRWVNDRWESVRWVNDRWESVRWVGDDWESVRWVSGDWASVRWVADSWGSVRWVSAAWGR